MHNRCQWRYDALALEQLANGRLDSVLSKHLCVVHFDLATLGGEGFIFTVEQGSLSKAELLLIGAAHLHAVIDVLLGDRQLCIGIFHCVACQA